MSIDIPNDLIKQVQAAVLREANFSSYDPDDASFPDQPSLESSISELDPSPPYLRCKHCNGRFLRGVQSLICVFCGKQQAPQDAPPEPVNFKTTFGCRWLLESLGLDGSEIVGFPVNGNESNRGQDTAQEEFPLSDLLDLEITWNPKFDKLGTGGNESSLNIAGDNLDNFFAERKRDDSSAVTVDQSLAIKNVNNSGNDDFQVRDSFSFFENAQSSKTAVRSIEYESGSGSFGGWDANFQSVGTGTSHAESKSFDPVDGAPADRSVHMDAVFGSGNNVGKDKEDIVSSGSKTDDWVQADLCSNSNSGKSGHSKQVEVIANENNGWTVQNANISSSMSIDRIQDGQWQSESNEAHDNNKTVDEGDDIFHTWNDFASSTNAERLSDKQMDQTKQFEGTTTVNDGGKVENPNNSYSRNIDLIQAEQLQTVSIKAPDKKPTDKEDNAFDEWNDFASSTSAQCGRNKQFELTAKDGRTVENPNTLSSNVDWFQETLLEANSRMASENKTIEVDDDFFDSWNDFTSSTNGQDPLGNQTGQASLFEMTTDKDGGTVETANKSTSIAWIQDVQWPTISDRLPDNKATDEGDDLFDTWNGFKSSTTAADLTSKQIGHAKPFEVNTNVKDHGIMEVNNSSFDLFQGDQWQTSSNKTPDNKTINEDHDSFDAWNDFTSSTRVQDPSDKLSVNHNHMSSSVEQSSEIKLLETKNNLQNIYFGSFSQPHIFSGAFSDQNGSALVNMIKSKPSDSNGIPGEAAEGGEVSSATTRSTTNDVEIIMSQMHDLSFMLASDLSIPPK